MTKSGRPMTKSLFRPKSLGATELANVTRLWRSVVESFVIVNETTRRPVVNQWNESSARAKWPD